jgi:hypothetical protein
MVAERKVFILADDEATSSGGFGRGQPMFSEEMTGGGTSALEKGDDLLLDRLGIGDVGSGHVACSADTYLCPTPEDRLATNETADLGSW